MKRDDMTGRRYGKLTMVAFVESAKSPIWLARCDCGQTVHVRRVNVLTGNTRSCGCLPRGRKKKAA